MIRAKRLIGAMVCAACLLLPAANAAVNADRSTIRVQDDGTEFSFYDTRNIAMSADGRFVVEAVTGSTSATGSLAITDMQLRETNYIRNNQGGLITQSQVFVAMSPSGRYVAVRPNDFSDPTQFGSEGRFLYLYDAKDGSLNPVEKSIDGSPLANCTAASAIVGSSLHNWGQDDFVGDKELMFYSTCSNLVSNDNNGAADIFVYDIEQDSIELLTRNPVSGESFAGQSVNPKVSQDGRIAAFASKARDIVDFTCHPVYETQDLYHVYVLNRDTNVYTHLNFCHAGDTSIIELSYDVSSDGEKVHFFGRTHHNHQALVSLDTGSGVVSRTELPYSNSGPLETNHDGSVVLYRSNGYFDEAGVHHDSFAGSFVNAYHLYNVDTDTHTLLSTDITSDDVYFEGFTQWHATLSPSAHVVTFGASRLRTTNQALVDTTMTAGEASAYFYLHQAFAKNAKWVTLRGTFSDWNAYAGGMTLVGDHLWEIEVDFTTPGAFKFDLAGDWSVNYGDNNGDGIGDSDGADISVAALGRYRITFNDQTNAYTTTAIIDDSCGAPSMFLRGNFNSWGSTAMTCVASKWRFNGNFAASTEFKFDIAGDWAENYGDNGQDGFADQNGANIVIFDGGDYQIYFDYINDRFYQITSQ